MSKGNRWKRKERKIEDEDVIDEFLCNLKFGVSLNELMETSLDPGGGDTKLYDVNEFHDDVNDDSSSPVSKHSFSSFSALDFYGFSNRIYHSI